MFIFEFELACDVTVFKQKGHFCKLSTESEHCFNRAQHFLKQHLKSLVKLFQNFTAAPVPPVVPTGLTAVINYTMRVGDIITSSSHQYRVQDILGSGSFGLVTLCHKISTNETVAVKMMKVGGDLFLGKVEEAILQEIQKNGSANFNIVQWFGSFDFMGHYCHEFEKLDISLRDYLDQYGRLTLKEIRPIVHQMATALMFLKNLRIIHADLKPENIMMVDHLSQPLKIKIIDFGLACSVSQKEQGTVQTRPYRAPEVFLGVRYNEAIDVWSMGCTVAELFTGWLLFPRRDKYDTKDPSLFYLCLTTTLDICRSYPVRHPNGQVDPAEECDYTFFQDLVRMMLSVNPEDRLTPEEVLRHPFVSLSHLTGLWESDYVIECQSVMASVLAPPSVEEQQDTLLPYYTSLAEPTPVTTKEPPTPTKHLRDYFNGDQDAQSPHRYFNQVMLSEDHSGPRGVSPEYDTDGTPTLDETPIKKKRRVVSKEQDCDSEGFPQWLIVETPVCPKRHRVEEDDSTDSDYDSDGTPTLDETPIKKKRRVVSKEQECDSEGFPQWLIVETPVCPKRGHVEEDDSTDSDYDSDGNPRLIIVDSPVLQKRRCVDEDHATDYNSDGLVIVESPVGLKRQHSETSEPDEAWSGKRRRLGPKAF